PPAFDIATIADDFVVDVREARAPVLATGTSDAVGGAVTLGYLLGGVQTVVQADGSWSVPVPIAGLEGKIPFIGRVPDAAGNFGVDAELVFVDKSHAPADLSATKLDGNNGFKLDGIDRLDESGKS